MEQQISVAGRGVAELPIPAWLRLARIALVFGTFAFILCGAFLLNGWRWVTDAGADGLSPAFAIWCAAIVTASVAAPALLVRRGIYNAFLNFRAAASDGRLVFGGFRSVFRPLVILLAATGSNLAAAYFVYSAATACPLPELLTKLRIETSASPADAGMIPIYFWDYATRIEPAWLDHINIVMPYEKGPPQKLLSKIFFEDSTTHAIVLELNGKRPRSYNPGEVYGVFDAPVAQPRDWPLIWRLEREAGLTTDGLNAPILYLMRISQGVSSEVTQAIGVPWDASRLTSTTAERPSPADPAAHPEKGRVFFWGPDGSVFQVKCPSPCAMARMLELVQFPRDPKGSRAERIEWTKGRLKELLTALDSPPAKTAGAQAASDATTRSRRESLLSIYLVSMLTLDPRDPEAFFHLGKLARNLTTVRSAISYGRDVGLEHEKIVELEGVADRLSP